MTLTGTTTGFEFMSVQSGADFKLTDDVGLGPFVGLSLGEYSNVSVDCPGGVAPSLCSDRLENKAFHGWLALGVRGVYSP